MKADEIRGEVRRNVEKFDGNGDQLLRLMQYGATMEVAAQLAELNARLAGKFSLETMD